MKRIINQVLASAVILPMLGAAAMAESVVLKYSPFVTVTHYVNTEVVMPFAKAVEKATEGRVKFEALPKMVGNLGNQYDVCKDGLADVCLPVLGYTPGRFPLASIGELPFKNFDPVATDAKFYDFYMQNFGKYDEFKGTKVLSLFPFSGHNLLLKNKKIGTIGDFSGLKIRVSGDNSVELLKALGGVPILKPVNEVFELLSTGAIDGVVTSDEGLLTNQFADVINRVVIIPGGFTDAVFALTMNSAKWDAISPGDQKILLELAGGKVGEAAGRAAAAANQRGQSEAKKKNVTIEVLSDEVFAALKEKAKPVDDRWIAAANKAGVTDAAQILQNFRDEMSRRM